MSTRTQVINSARNIFHAAISAVAAAVARNELAPPLVTTAERAAWRMNVWVISTNLALAREAINNIEKAALPEVDLGAEPGPQVGAA